MVEQNVVRALYSISLTFDLPGNTLAAREQQHDLKAGIRAAFAELERQLEKHKATVRGEHWKRPKRREEVREMKAQAASSTSVPGKRDLFFSMVTPHLQRLNHFVRHVMLYSEAMGDFPPGKFNPQDVVDSTLVRAYREFLKGRSIHNVKHWLIRLALDQLDSEIARLPRHVKRAHKPKRVA